MTSSYFQTSAVICRRLVLAFVLQGLFSLTYTSDVGTKVTQSTLTVDATQEPTSLAAAQEALQAAETADIPARPIAHQEQPQEAGEAGQQSLTQSPLTLEEYTRCLAQQLELDETLVLAVLIQESHPVDPFRVGKGDSRGPLQIKPIALEAVGLSRDAQQLPFLVYGGLLYLKSMLTRFPDPPTALAAYNMGPVRLKQRAYRPYISTRRYVEQILTRQEQIRSATFRSRPVLHYQLSEKELAIFPDQDDYPAECHLRQFHTDSFQRPSPV